MDVSIIIPFYKRQVELKALLHSLASTVPENIGIETVVVEDGTPVEGKADLETRHNRLNLRFLTNDRNRGPAYSRNHGAEETSGKYLWFLDTDTVVARPDTLDALIIALKEDPARLVAGGVIERAEGQNFFMRPSLMPAIHFLYEKVTPRDDYQEEVDFLSTTNFFVTRNNFLAVGGFDANLRMAEDNEICLRLRKMIGGSFYQNAKTLVLHDISDVGRGADTFEYLNNRFNYMVVKFKTRKILLRRYQPWRLACLPVLEAISIMIYFAGAKARKWHLARVDKVKSDAPVMAMIKDALVLTLYCIVGMSLLFLPADQGKRLGKSP